ncbi:hypothetical protein SLA2020_470890 [Shorea laevis]
MSLPLTSSQCMQEMLDPNSDKIETLELDVSSDENMSSAINCYVKFWSHRYCSQQYRDRKYWPFSLVFPLKQSERNGKSTHWAS